MGKRELLIIVAFAAIGVLAYELTAPPAKEGQGFSLSRMLSNARRQVQSNQPIASFTTNGTIAVGAEVTELRIAAVPRGIQVIGEDRRDIAYELRVESSGPDPAAALELAKKTKIKQDDLGSSVALSVVYPRDATQYSGLTLNVPSRLAVRIVGPGAGGARAEHLAALDLDRVSGITTAGNIAGQITGVVSNGELTIVNAGSVNLTLSATRARFSKVARGVVLNTRSGRCEISDSQGALTIEETNTEVLVSNHAGTMRATGSGGRLTIENPRQAVNVDVRQAPISLTLQAAVPVSIFGVGERVRVLLDAAAAVTVDAVAAGRVDATDFGLTPEAAGPDQEQHLTHAFGKSNAPRVTLRNSRGDIVIGKRK